jgi:hypothetical protein
MYWCDRSVFATQPVERLARRAIAAKHGDARHAPRDRFAHDAFCWAHLTSARYGNLKVAPRLQRLKHTIE